MFRGLGFRGFGFRASGIETGVCFGILGQGRGSLHESFLKDFGVGN